MSNRSTTFTARAIVLGALLCTCFGAGALTMAVGGWSATSAMTSLTAGRLHGPLAVHLRAIPRPLVPDHTQQKSAYTDWPANFDVLGPRLTDLPSAPAPAAAWQVERSRSVSAPWHEAPGTQDPKILYFTFDDGPYPYWTDRIMALMEKYEGRATFFQLGVMRRQFPEIVERVEASGHRMASKGDRYRAMTGLTTAGMRNEIRRGAPSKCFRPPYGMYDDQVEKVVSDAGMRIVTWTIDAQDWRTPGVSAVVKQIMSNVEPGAIILMHDGNAGRTQTVEALEQVLPVLSERGYEFHALPC